MTSKYQKAVEKLEKEIKELTAKRLQRRKTGSKGQTLDNYPLESASELKLEGLKLGRKLTLEEVDKLIDKKIFGYDSEEGTQDFVSLGILKVLKKLKEEFK